MTKKKILWIDMDGVLVDFTAHVKEVCDKDDYIAKMYKGREDRIPGVFRNPKPIKGAIESIKLLEQSGLYEMYIATAAPWGNPESACDKRYWIEEHFGRLFRKKMAITHLKNLLIGDYLIDDRTANGAGEFTGEHIHFGTEKFPDWEAIVKYLI